MRARLALLSVAITSVVVLAFCIPLAGLIRIIAANNALDAGKLESRSVAGALSVVRDPATIAQLVQQANAGSPRPVTVFLPDGRVIGAPAAATAAVQLAEQGRSFTATGPHGSRLILVGVRGPDGRSSVVEVMVAGALLRRGVTHAWIVLAGLGLAMLVISLAVSDALARSIVTPIDDLVEVAGRLREGDLDARVVPAGPPEVAQVGVAVNELAERIGNLLAAEREASADLSHQLRTPLTSLRLDAESLRRADERRRITNGVDSLERAVNHVIEESRRPSPTRRGQAPAAAADLGEAVRRRMTFWAVLADKQRRPLEVETDARDHRVAARREELDVVIDALVANVFSHTLEGTALAVRVKRSGSNQVLLVEDAGPGLPGDMLPKRGASYRGTGLGLDIVRRTAETSGGQLSVGRSAAGGARIEVTFGPAPAS